MTAATPVLSRTRSGGCLSDLQLDQLLLGELGVDDEAAAHAHLEGCPRCQTRRASLVEDQRRFAASHPALPSLALPVAPSPPPEEGKLAEVIPLARRMRPVVATVVALAAGLALFLLPGGEGGPEVQSKGRDFLSFFVKRGEALREWSPGQPLHPGDKLRFVVDTRTDAYVAVLSRDAAGTFSVYYPLAQRTAEVKGSLEPTALPLATELDAVLGGERLLGVLCDQAVFLAELERAFRARPDNPALPAGCRGQTLVVRKVKAGG